MLVFKLFFWWKSCDELELLQVCKSIFVQSLALFQIDDLSKADLRSWQKRKLFSSLKFLGQKVCYFQAKKNISRIALKSAHNFFLLLILLLKTVLQFVNEEMMQKLIYFLFLSSCQQSKCKPEQKVESCRRNLTDQEKQLSFFYYHFE